MDWVLIMNGWAITICCLNGHLEMFQFLDDIRDIAVSSIHYILSKFIRGLLNRLISDTIGIMVNSVNVYLGWLHFIDEDSLK